MTDEELKKQIKEAMQRNESNSKKFAEEFKNILINVLESGIDDSGGYGATGTR